MIDAITSLIVIACALTAFFMYKRENSDKSQRKMKNFTDSLLDKNLLHLKSDGSYHKYMNEMLKKNAEFHFVPVQSYKEFKVQLFLSLGGDAKYFTDYEVIVLMLLFVSNKHLWKMGKLLPRFLLAVVRVKCNGLGHMKNTMHMLTLHATSIGGYLSKSLEEDFLTLLKKVRIVRENTGFYEGKKVLFSRVRNPFLGSRVCPLSGKHKRILFPPLVENHEFLDLHNFGNALGVSSTNRKLHTLDGSPLLDHDMMTVEGYWNTRFPEEMPFL